MVLHGFTWMFGCFHLFRAGVRNGNDPFFVLVAGREDRHGEQQRWNEGHGREGNDALGEFVLLLGAVDDEKRGLRHFWVVVEPYPSEKYELG